MAAVQFARAYGMTVLGTAGSDEGLKLVREFGAHFVFNHRQEDYMDEILVSTSKIPDSMHSVNGSLLHITRTHPFLLKGFFVSMTPHRQVTVNEKKRNFGAGHVNDITVTLGCLYLFYCVWKEKPYLYHGTQKSQIM